MPARAELFLLALQLLFAMTKKPPSERGSKGNKRLARKERRARDMLPYARHIDETTLATRDGQQIQILHLTGFAFETADTQELNYRKNVRDTLMRGIASSRLTVGAHVIRHMVHPGLEGRFTNAFSRYVDDMWRDRLNGRRLFVNDLFVTITRKPALGRAGFLGQKKQWDAVSRARDRRELDAAADSLLAALQPYGARVLGVYETAAGVQFSEPLEFLAFLFDGELRPVPYDRTSVDFIDRRVSFGRDALEFSGNARSPRTLGAMLSIKEYPPHTSAGQLDALLRTPQEMVISQSFSFVDRQPALSRMNLALRRMRAA